MAALTPRNQNLSVDGSTVANKGESKIAAAPEIDVPTMTSAETEDLLTAAASSMKIFPPTVPTRAEGTTSARTNPNQSSTLRLSQKKIVPHLDISDNPSEVFVSKFSPDGALLAAGCGDGAVRVFDAETGRLNYNLNIAAHAMPTTALCFRPVTETSRTRNVLIAANADGSVQHWHITSGRCLHEINDPENPLFTVNYSANGKKFATAGKDFAVRVYDEATKTLVSKMEGGYHAITKGHSNRVFSLKFDEKDDNILVSGGWDNTVQIWDLRVERSVRSFYGPHICGDAVDVYDGTILTGSYRNNNQLQTWDLGTGKLIKDIPWGGSSNALSKGQSCQLYAASFSPGGELIGAGGAGVNEAKIFDRTCGDALVGTVAGLSRGVYSLDFNSDGSKFVVAGGDCTVRLFSVQNRKEKNGD